MMQDVELDAIIRNLEGKRSNSAVEPLLLSNKVKILLRNEFSVAL